MAKSVDQIQDEKEEVPALSDEERAEFLAREQHIAFYQRTLSLLRSEQNLFTGHLLSSKGLDPNQRYTIDEDGKLIQAEG